MSNENRAGTEHTMAYVDGGCRPTNPGPGAIGVVLHHPGEDTKTISECIGNSTNQRAELTAAIYALEEAHPDGHVKVFSDSNYLVQIMNARWKRKTNLDLFSTLDDLVSSQRSVEFVWVKCHSATYHEYAQDLVEQAFRNSFLRLKKEAE